MHFPMIKKYHFADIIRRLEKAVNSPVGKRGFRILLYGWRIKHHLPVYLFYGRDYLTDREMRSFSAYAGYDLMQDND